MTAFDALPGSVHSTTGDCVPCTQGQHASDGAGCLCCGKGVSGLTWQQYTDERQAIIDDYTATGQHARYERDVERLNAAADAAGLFKGGE